MRRMEKARSPASAATARMAPDFTGESVAARRGARQYHQALWHE